MVYGDKRPYLVAVVVPDLAFVEDWASQNGRSARLETLCDSEAFRKAVGRAVDRVNRDLRSEERRAGKECVRPCRSRWWPYHYTKKNDTTLQSNITQHLN